MPLPHHYTISPCTNHDYDSIYDTFIHHFVPDEYLCKAINFTEEQDGTTLISNIVGGSVGSGVSVKCIDSRTNEIVGYRLAVVEDLNEQEVPLNTSHFSWKEKAIYSVLQEGSANIKAHLPNARKILKFRTLVVKGQHRRQGIAEAMVNECIRLGKAKGCDHVIVGTGNARPQRLFEKQGFQRLREIRYDEYLFEGRPVFAGYDDGMGTDAFVVFSKAI